MHSEEVPWVVFIHGAGGSIRTWKRQETFFARYFNVLLMDLRDHGESKNIQPSHKSYSFELISTDIKRTLDANGIKKAHFITLSFGSVLIQDFVSRFPNYADRLIFVGAVFSGGIGLRLFVYFAKLMNLFLSYPIMYKLFSYLLMPKESNQFARRLYQSQAKKITQDEYMKWVGMYGEFFKLLKQFSSQSLKNDSLIVMGSDDHLFLKSARKYRNKQHGVQLLEITETGHIVNIEKAEIFNKEALEFLHS